MPSQALAKFRYNVVDVDRLIESHSKLHNGDRGKKALGHITRSGVVMLCAAWELYAESLLLEGLTFLLSKCAAPNDLPLVVQKELSRHVKESKHELKPLDLANSGWRNVLLSHAQETVARLNTPKPGPLNDIFNRLIGLADLTPGWSCGAGSINDFVTVRGEIAHQGRSASYVKIGQLKDYLATVKVTAVETDNLLVDYLVSCAPGGARPWNKSPL